MFDDPMENSINQDTTQKDTFMRNAYISIMSFPDKAIDHELPKKVKINALDNIINYFEGIEEFEKCQDLLEIKRAIEEY